MQINLEIETMKSQFDIKIPEGWSRSSFSKIVDIVMGQSPAGDTYNTIGKGVALINGPTEFTDRFPIEKQWTTSPTKVCNRGDILLCVRGSSTGRINVANSEYCIGRGVAAIRAKTNSDNLFVEYELNFVVNKILKLTAGSTFPNVDSKSLKSIEVLLPPLPEQQAIAAILSTWDKGIEKLQQLIAAKQKRKKALMQQLLTGKKRFKEFTDEWQEVRLGKVLKERVETNRPDLKLLSITSSDGVVDRDTLEKRDTSNQDKSKYRRISPGDIGYNTMRLWQGVAALSSLEGIISPAYTVVVPQEQVFGPFLAYLFKFPAMIHTFYRHSQGLVDDTRNCKYNHFARIKVKLPGEKEQQKIASVLRVADKEIEALQQKLNAMKQQKKGLMQKLLTGQVRVNLKAEPVS